MAEGLEEELLGHRGHADVLAVVNCAARLSRALRGESDPGVVCSVASGVSGKGAPYSKPGAGKVKVRCVNWEDGCEVREEKKVSLFDALEFTVTAGRRKDDGRVHINEEKSCSSIHARRDKAVESGVTRLLC
jgi:hypothetical protein